MASSPNTLLRMLTRALFFVLWIASVTGVWAGTSPRQPAATPVVPPPASNATEAGQAVEGLEALERYVIQEHATLAAVRATHPELLAGLNLRETSTPGIAEEGPLGISSLIWGLIGGLLGSCLLGGGGCAGGISGYRR